MLRFSDPERLRRLRIAPEVARSSIVWLHAFLSDLERVGFVAPAPVRDLDGDSIAVVDGVIWELLTFVPGGAMDWSDPDTRAAGALLARFHDASRRTPARAQRPGALPIIDCRPGHSDARRVRALVERELALVGYDGALRAVVHGDATQANVVIDDGTYRLVDYALAYIEPTLFDIGYGSGEDLSQNALAPVREPCQPRIERSRVPLLPGHTQSGARLGHARPDQRDPEVCF